jgi:hypothetical protein
VVIVVVLPLFELRVGEVNVVRNPVAIGESVDLLITVLAIQVGHPRPDVDVTKVERLEMPVKLGLEFGAVVSLNDLGHGAAAAA